MCAISHMLRLRRGVLVVAIGLLSAPCRAGEKPAATPAKPPEASAAESPSKATGEPGKLETASEAVQPAGSLWSPRIDAIRRILDKPIDLDLQEVPLADLCKDLEKRLGIQVQIAKKALHDAGIQPDAPLSYKAAGISARSALHTILSDIGLTWTVQNEVLLITTPEDAESHLLIKTYNVADLVAAQDAEGRPVDAFDSLIQTITGVVDRDSWIDHGGPCPISACSAGGVKAVVIGQTIQTHEEVEALLADLRALRDRPAPAVGAALRQIDTLGKPAATNSPPTATATAPPGVSGEAGSLVMPAPPTWETSLSRVLDQKVTLNVQKELLSDVVTRLQEMLKIPVQISDHAILGARTDRDDLVTVQAKDVSARDALNLLTKSVGLTWTLRGKALWITTQEDAESQDEGIVRVYDVADLASDATGLDRLVDLIATTVSDSWDEIGKPSRIATCCARAFAPWW